jgi:hypothetical protein
MVIYDLSMRLRNTLASDYLIFVEYAIDPFWINSSFSSFTMKKKFLPGLFQSNSQIFQLKLI